MRIEDALPDIFKRTYPVLEKGTQLLLAASLLRFHQIDAIPIGFSRKQKTHQAVLGYSCLSQLLKVESGSYKDFLEQPCENAAQELATISADMDVDELLKLFDSTKFGFAMVVGKYELGALVSLRDLLGLYAKGYMNSSLILNDIASPIISMSSDATLREVLQEMFTRRIRRIFVDGKKKDQVITDRRIISYVFSSSRLEEIAKSSLDILDTPVNKIETMQPAALPSNTKLKDAAETMGGEIEECLVCEKGVITPWDVIMKPWKMRKLTLKAALRKTVS
jgi:CBS domain-containing protein